MFSLCWHYLLCGILLAACLLFVMKGYKKVGLLLTGIMLVTATVGFILVYMGPFRESGKTFLGYVIGYGIFTLPVFLFPVLGLWACKQESE